jgi:hypothetical protein
MDPFLSCPKQQKSVPDGTLRTSAARKMIKKKGLAAGSQAEIRMNG